MHNARKNTLTIVFGATVLLWILFNILTKHTAMYEGPVFQFVLKPFLVGMTLIPLLGGLYGLKQGLSWGGWKSSLGKAINSLSIGLLCWSGGMVIWNYYLFFTEIEVPYPSLADAVFILSWPFWTFGVYHLSKATGARFGLKSRGGKHLLYIIPAIVSLVSYYLLFQVARGGEIDLSVEAYQLFFDLFYPIGDVVILTIVAVVYSLSRKLLGGKYKIPILILFTGFGLNYLTDLIFSYTTTVETYFNGHFVDLLFTITMYVLSLSIIEMDPKK